MSYITSFNSTTSIPIFGDGAECAELITSEVGVCQDAYGNWQTDNGDLGNGCASNWMTVTVLTLQIDPGCLTPVGGSSGGGSTGGGSTGGGSTGGGSNDGSGSTGGNNNSGGIPQGNNVLDSNSNTKDLTTTPILISNTQLAINKFYANLSPNLKQWVDNNSKTYNDILNYLISKQGNSDSDEFSPESVQFAENLINIAKNYENQSNVNLLINSLIEIKNTFEIDSINLFNQQYDYISRMSESELIIYNNMLPNRKMWYLASAYKASNKSLELFPNSQQHNGKGDAFRHALWNALSSLTIGYDLTQQLTTAHEEVPFTYQYQFKEKNMDLHNNGIGLTISNYSNLNNVVSNVISRFNSGYMVYLNNLDTNNLATHLSQQIPSNQ